MDTIYVPGDTGSWTPFCNIGYSCSIDCTVYVQVCDDLLNQPPVQPIEGDGGGGGGGGTYTPPPNPLAGVLTINGDLLAGPMTNEEAAELLNGAVADCIRDQRCNDALSQLRAALQRDIGTDIEAALRKFSEELFRHVGVYANTTLGYGTFTIRSGTPPDQSFVQLGRVVGAASASGSAGFWLQLVQSRGNAMVSGSLEIEPYRFLNFGINFEIDSQGNRIYTGATLGASVGVGGAPVSIIIDIPLQKPIKPE